MKYKNKVTKTQAYWDLNTPKERKTSGVSKTQTTEISDIIVPNALFEAVNLITLNTL